MKNKLIDKKIIFLFLIMIIMVVFMINFLNKQKVELQEQSELSTDDRLLKLSKKQKSINDFLDNNDGLFSKGLQEIFRKLDLVSYIKLPLDKDSEHNEYPFGRISDLE
jgi:hypothetical protein